MELTTENYHSFDANREYLSVSQVKAFMRCQAAWFAQYRTGTWSSPFKVEFLIGSYVDAAVLGYEGGIDQFMADNPKMKKGNAPYKMAVSCVEAIAKYHHAKYALLKP